MRISRHDDGACGKGRGTVTLFDIRNAELADRRRLKTQSTAGQRHTGSATSYQELWLQRIEAVGALQPTVLSSWQGNVVTGLVAEVLHERSCLLTR